ncbi:MAG TPA: glycosyltransferase family 2 protein [Parvibaculum sp.]
MIVRNEAHHLPDCLRSIAGLVDEIVIVDTGSTDATIDIARSFGATVVESVWQGDFAAPRNLSLDHCRAEWILYIDADERLEGIGRAQLAAALSDGRHVCYRTWLRPRVGYTPYLEYRLFRNDPRIRFRSKIHESMVSEIKAVALSDGLEIGVLDAVLEHIGYEGDQSAKHRRNLPLLREQIVHSPHRIFLWWHLGHVLEGLGEVEEAEAAWTHGVELARREVDGTTDAMPYLSLIGSRIDRGEDAGELLADAKRRFPTNYYLHFLDARQLMAEKRFAEALKPLLMLAAIDGETYRDEQCAYNMLLFGLPTYEALATCYFRLGNFVESARWYARAEEVAPERADLRAKRVVAAARA